MPTDLIVQILLVAGMFWLAPAILMWVGNVANIMRLRPYELGGFPPRSANKDPQFLAQRREMTDRMSRRAHKAVAWILGCGLPPVLLWMWLNGDF